MNDPLSIWKAAEHAIKLLFDSLRNIGISASVVAASAYLERNPSLTSSRNVPEMIRFLGYVLIFISIAYFVVAWVIFIFSPSGLNMRNKIRDSKDYFDPRFVHVLFWPMAIPFFAAAFAIIVTIVDMK